jgi:hypothetical protein
MPTDLARIRRPVRAQTIGNLLIKNSSGRLPRRRKVGVGRTGARSPRCSGFLAFQKHFALVQVHYVHDEGDDTATSERIEADRDREIQVLLQEAGYTAEIPDSPIPGHVGVHVWLLGEPTEEEWQALRRIADGQVTYRPGDSSVTGLTAPEVLPALVISQLATTTRESTRHGTFYIRLTDAGEGLLADRLTVGAGEIMVQVLETED